MIKNKETYREEVRGYDIIGDIRGNDATLKALLYKLGYFQEVGKCSHPHRKVIFLGNSLKRIPCDWTILTVIRAMTDSGTALAILGDNEFNTLAYHALGGKRGFSHSYIDTDDLLSLPLHDEIVRMFPEKWITWLDWLRTLPLSLDLNGLRAVHAAWQDRAVASAKELGPLTPAKLALMVNNRSSYCRMKEVLLDGLEHEPYAADAPPLFMGHFRLHSKNFPALQVKNIACLNYSPDNWGTTTAYRWDGELELDPTKYVTMSFQEAMAEIKRRGLAYRSAKPGPEKDVAHRALDEYLEHTC